MNNYKDGLKKWAKKEKVFSAAEIKLDGDILFIEVDSEDIEEADQEGEIDPVDLGEDLNNKGEQFIKDVRKLSKKYKCTVSEEFEAQEEFPWVFGITIFGDKKDIKTIYSELKNQEDKYTFSVRVSIDDDDDDY